MVFTTRLSGGKGGRNGLEHELRRLGVSQKNGKPNHPQTQGKVERFQQTLKNWLARPAAPARHHRRAPGPARRLRQPSTTAAARTDRCPRRATPAAAYAARPKASPGDRTADTHDRVRTDRIDRTGLVTLRDGGRLHHIGIGRTHAGTHVMLLVQDLDIRVINAATGELLRELTLDPDQRLPAHRPTTRPAKENTRTWDAGLRVSGSRCGGHPRQAGHRGLRSC